MKYTLTNNKKEVCGRILYQIEALKDFSDVKRGDLGGWIQKEDNLSQGGSCWVYDDAWVYGYAKVYENAQVYGNALVCDDAWVCGNARVYEHAQVYDDAWVCGNAQVYGYAKVCKNAQVCGNAQVCENACLSANLRYKKGCFIGGDDTGKIADITDKTGTCYWKVQYVLGDYKIEEPENEIEIDGKKYSKSTIKSALKDYIK